MNKVVKATTYCILLLVLVVAMFPFYMVLIMGTWNNDDLMKTLPFFVGNFTLGNMKAVFGANFLMYYSNSLIVSLSAVALCTLSSSLIGYAVAKFNFKLKSFLNYFIIITMMVPGQVSIVGYIMEMRSFHLTNTLFPIIVCWIANPFGAFFMTQFMKESVPNEVIESARIDGCSEPRIFTSIVFPFIKPGIATLAMLVFLWSWNSYMLPLISISKNRWFTIPVFVSTLGAEYRDDMGARMSALTFSTFPILILFSIFSKTFIKGIASGSVKG